MTITAVCDAGEPRVTVSRDKDSRTQKAIGPAKRKYTESNLPSITGIESGINSRSGGSFDFSSYVHRIFGGFDYGFCV
jgi:hypothetical protein